MNVQFNSAQVGVIGQEIYLSLRLLDYGEAIKAKQFVAKMAEGALYAAELKKTHKKRSLDANAYFWGLADKLTEVLKIPKTEIYRNAIREIGGVSEQYCGQPKAIEKLCREWEKQGLGWMTETYPSKIPGCVNVTLYYGSSSYDSAQMSRLIDNIVQECKAQGIETMTPEGLERLKGAWREQENKGTGDLPGGETGSSGA